MVFNKKGFSIAEMTVGLAIGGLVALSIADVLSYIAIYNRRIQMTSESRIATTLGERFLWLHFKNADPSYNVLKGPNFTDNSGQDFYTLVPDGNSQMFTTTQLSRTVTLQPGGKTKFGAIIINTADHDVQRKYSPTFFADPAKFYNISPGQQTSIGQGPSVDWTLFKNYINQQNPNILSATNKYIEVYSPILVRDNNKMAPVPPNPVAYFLRYAGGTSFSTETFGGAVGYTNAVNPALSTLSFDTFLKSIPSAGGGIPPIAARSVKMIQYEIVQHSQLVNNQVVYDLQYETWDGTAFSNPVLVAIGISSVTLSRPDVTDPLITATITEDTKAYQ